MVRVDRRSDRARGKVIDPNLTVQANKHLTYLRNLLAASRPGEQARADIKFHATQLHGFAWQILEASKNDDAPAG